MGVPSPGGKGGLQENGGEWGGMCGNIIGQLVIVYDTHMSCDTDTHKANKTDS